MIRRNKKPQRADNLSPFIIAFFNLVIFVGLAVVFGQNIPLECVSSFGIGVSAGLVTLGLFHLIWRYLGEMLMHIDIQIGSHKVRIGQFAKLFESLHLRVLPDFILWGQFSVFLVLAAVLWFPSTSPFTHLDTVPNIQEFLVYHTPNHPETYGPGDLLPIPRGTGVHIEARAIAQPNISCAWSTTRGSLFPEKGCATQYSTPIEGNRDTLTVEIRSPCKTYRISTNLHIGIIQ